MRVAGYLQQQQPLNGELHRCPEYTVCREGSCIYIYLNNVLSKRDFGRADIRNIEEIGMEGTGIGCALECNR